MKTQIYKNNKSTSSSSNRELWNSNSSNFSNSCAIRLGVALASSGIDTRTFPGTAHCWHHKKTEGHTLRAEELAKGLVERQGFLAWLGKRQEVWKPRETPQKKPREVAQSLKGKKGIIFFKDYYGPGNSGDHIDLWNGSRLTEVGSHLRQGEDHYFEAREIWFWQVQ